MNAPTKKPLSHRVIYLLLSLLAAITPLAIDMYLPAIPTIAAALGTSSLTMQLSISAYLIGFALAQLIYGPITDAIGRLPVLIFGITLFAISSVVIAHSDNFTNLILGRVVQAIGGASASVVVMTQLRDLFSKEEFAKAMSIVVLIMTLAPLVAPIMGSFLLHHFGWQSIFYTLALVAALIALLIVVVIGETLPHSNRKKLSFSVAISGYRAILANRGIMLYTLVGICSSGILFSFISSSAFMYIEYFGATPSQFSLYFGLNIISIMMFTSFNAKFVSKFGTQKMVVIGVMISSIMATLLMLSVLIGFDSVWSVVIPITLLMGTMGFVGTNSLALAVEFAPTMSGSISGVAGFLRFAFGALIGSIINLLHISSPVPTALTMFTLTLISASAIYQIKGKNDE